MNDPIIAELHRLRELHAQRFNFDLDLVCEDLRESHERAKALGRKYVSFAKAPVASQLQSLDTIQVPLRPRM
jgi:hypothetical protein